MRSWEHCGQWGLFTERVNSGCGDLGAGHFLRGCGVPARSSSAYLARVELHSVHCHEPLREAAPQAVDALRRKVSLLPHRLTPLPPSTRGGQRGVRVAIGERRQASKVSLLPCSPACRSLGMRCYWPSNLIPQLCVCDGLRVAVREYNGSSRDVSNGRSTAPIPQTPVRSLSPPRGA